MFKIYGMVFLSFNIFTKKKRADVFVYFGPKDEVVRLIWAEIHRHKKSLKSGIFNETYKKYNESCLNLWNSEIVFILQDLHQEITI